MAASAVGLAPATFPVGDSDFFVTGTATPLGQWKKVGNVPTVGRPIRRSDRALPRNVNFGFLFALPNEMRARIGQEDTGLVGHVLTSEHAEVQSEPDFLNAVC